MVASPSERAEEDDNVPPSQLLHQTTFAVNSQREGITTNPHSILRRRIQRNDAAWEEIRFESKTQSLKA